MQGKSTPHVSDTHQLPAESQRRPPSLREAAILLAEQYCMMLCPLSGAHAVLNDMTAGSRASAENTMHTCARNTPGSVSASSPARPAPERQWASGADKGLWAQRTCHAT